MKSNGTSINLFIVISLLFLFVTNCTEDYKNFKRATPVSDSNGKIDNGEAEPLEGMNRETKYHFVKREKTTYRSEFFRVKGKRQVIYNPKIKGEVNIIFTLGHLSKKNDKNLKAVVTINSGKENQIIGEFQNFKRAVTIKKKVTLSRSDTLIVELFGNGDIFISDPLFFKTSEKSPVFLIVADTLRADYLGVYGSKTGVSKNIDKFSDDSVIFDKCFSTTSWTLPSHISLFTSRNIFNHGVYTKLLRLSNNIPVFTEELSRDRFTVSFNEGVFVKYKYGFYRGFDRYSSRLWRARKFSRRLFENSVKLFNNKEITNIFSFLHTYQVHSPLRIHSGLDYSDSIKTRTIKEQFTFPYKLGNHERKYNYRRQPEKRRKNIISFYNSELEYFDHWFGYFIDELKKKGLYKKSLIVLMSDHGEEFFDHGTWGHGNNLYNETLRIPLIIKFPENNFKMQRIKTNCSILDIFPTIFDYLNIQYGFKTDGLSLLPILKGSDSNLTDRDIESMLIHTGSKEKQEQVPQMISIINGKYKLIYNFKYSEKLVAFYTEYPLPKYNEYELYNLDNDFSEKTNLINLPKYSEIFRRLKRKIDRLKKKIFENKIKGIPFKVTEKDLEKLKALGYL